MNINTSAQNKLTKEYTVQKIYKIEQVEYIHYTQIHKYKKSSIAVDSDFLKQGLLSYLCHSYRLSSFLTLCLLIKIVAALLLPKNDYNYDYVFEPLALSLFKFRNFDSILVYSRLHLLLYFSLLAFNSSSLRYEVLVR
ncbi:hypothetical protein PanWU01x14_080180 [Parasponia andersonii]|uniref:Uncharacterized protein n=1 Tax=Parasponia andersonii TaxID=3476 RepID=A0A2P5DBH5_PARAD|nr:hypothetical protein PanWU01x14_080180 [Parasponia andersonii]